MSVDDISLTIGTNMNELLPCPFCGCSAEIEQLIHNSIKPPSWYVGCDNCGFSLRSKTKKELVIKDWNTRTIPSPSRYPWSEAPEWANFAATDLDGTMWWYELKPSLLSCSWSESNNKVKEINPDYYCYWENSLEERPK